MKLSSISLLLFSEEIYVLEHPELTKTKNDQSYFFYMTSASELSIRLKK